MQNLMLKLQEKTELHFPLWDISHSSPQKRVLCVFTIKKKKTFLSTIFDQRRCPQLIKKQQSFYALKLIPISCSLVNNVMKKSPPKRVKTIKEFRCLVNNYDILLPQNCIINPGASHKLKYELFAQVGNKWFLVKRIILIYV